MRRTGLTITLGAMGMAVVGMLVGSGAVVLLCIVALAVVAWGTWA